MKAIRDSVVCVSMTTWEGDYVKSVVKLMEQLSSYSRVLFVDYQYTWKDVIVSFFKKTNVPMARMFGWKSPIREAHAVGEVYVLTAPPVLPINWIKNKRIHRWLNDINGRIVARAIEEARSELKMDRSIMINAYNPVMGMALKNRVNVERTYYYCYDEISQSEWCKSHGPTYEKEFARQTEAVFATSKGLVEKLVQLNERTLWIPNGVDFDLFSQAFKPAFAPEKRVCFIGSLDFRVDYALLDRLAKSLPEVEFDLVGRINERRAVQKLNRHSNVHVHGPKSPEELPNFLVQARVGIIPFVRNKFTRNVYPLKINEYLAAGLPVVTTNFSDMSSFAGVIKCVGSDEEFERALENGLHENDRGLREARNQLAFGNSWIERARLIMNFHQYGIRVS